MDEFESHFSSLFNKLSSVIFCFKVSFKKENFFYRIIDIIIQIPEVLVLLFLFYIIKTQPRNDNIPACFSCIFSSRKTIPIWDALSP